MKKLSIKIIFTLFLGLSANYVFSGEHSQQVVDQDFENFLAAFDSLYIESKVDALAFIRSQCTENLSQNNKSRLLGLLQLKYGAISIMDLYNKIEDKEIVLFLMK